MHLQAGCMHTRCSGTSSTDAATSIEIGKDSSSDAAAPDAAAADAVAALIGCSL